MHELFHLEETVPRAPGTSPFHVRGVYYARILEHVKSIPGGMPRFLDELVDPRVREFMRQRFHFMTWYDALPGLPCGVTIARIQGRPHEEYMRERARVSMVALAPSMFRLFSRFGGPRFAALHAPRLFLAYFDFLDLRLRNVSDCAGSGVLSGVPLYLAPAIVNQVIGIVAGALECLGASGIEASYRDVTPTISKNGFDMVTCKVDITWRLGYQAVGAPKHQKSPLRPPSPPGSGSGSHR